VNSLKVPPPTDDRNIPSLIPFHPVYPQFFSLPPAKKFRDFLNHTSYLDLKPNDDVTDILGFLSFEMVRTLCVSALELRRGLSDDPTQAVGNAAKIDAANQVESVDSPKDLVEGENGNVEDGRSSPVKEKVHGATPAPPLQPRHIMAAYQKMQRDEVRTGIGRMGLRNFRGGVVRRRVAII
jgi:transcription initiation protein SPT3